MATRKANRTKRRYARRYSEREHKKYMRITFAAIALTLVIAACILVYQTNQLKKEEQHYMSQINQVQDDIEQEKQRQEELSNKIKMSTSDNYIEEEARKRLNYIYNGEILIKSK